MPEIRLPAFVDSHVHLAQTGLQLSGLQLGSVRSRQELLEAVATFARRSSDAVLLGFGWDETRWSDATLPRLDELDRAAGGRPVLLSRVDGHSGLASGALLERAPDLADAPGWDGTGRVERLASRRAREVADGMITRAQRKAAIARALDAAAAAGLGAVHEMAAPHINAAEDIALIRELAAERDQIAVVPYWGEHVGDGGVRRALELGCAGAAGDLDVDGAIGSRTAGLRAPYADLDPADPAAHGHTYLDAEQVAAHVVACTHAGLQAGFHCIGDAGTAAAVEGLRLAARELGLPRLRDARHRLEHVELIDPAGIEELARYGVLVSAQPAFDAWWGGSDGMYARRLGADRALAANPLAAFADAGIRLAFGSDSPVTPFAPWEGVRAAAWHHHPDSRLSVADAFAAHTGGREPSGAPRSGATEHGGIPGQSWADWWLDDAPGPDGLPHLEPGAAAPTCLRTVVDGRTVYERDEDR